MEATLHAESAKKQICDATDAKATAGLPRMQHQVTLHQVCKVLQHLSDLAILLDLLQAEQS